MCLCVCGGGGYYIYPKTGVQQLCGDHCAGPHKFKGSRLGFRVQGRIRLEVGGRARVNVRHVVMKVKVRVRC